MRIGKRKGKAAAAGSVAGSKYRGKQDALAARVAGGVLRRQRQWADALNKRTGHLSGRFWRFALLLFCLASGSYCLYLVMRLWIS
jgi:hypothetical protein